MKRQVDTTVKRYVLKINGVGDTPEITDLQNEDLKQREEILRAIHTQALRRLGYNAVKE